MELRGEPGLLREAAMLSLGGVARQQLDRARTLARRVARAIDHTHRPLADLFFERVAAEPAHARSPIRALAAQNRTNPLGQLARAAPPRAGETRSQSDAPDAAEALRFDVCSLGR